MFEDFLHNTATEDEKCTSGRVAASRPALGAIWGSSWGSVWGEAGAPAPFWGGFGAPLGRFWGCAGAAAGFSLRSGLFSLSAS